MFELLDDYYPAPNAAFFVCDSEGRMIGCGRGSFELTGLKDEATLGRPVREVLGLRFGGGARTRSGRRWSGASGCSIARCGSRRRETSRQRPQQTSSRPTTTTADCCSS